MKSRFLIEQRLNEISKEARRFDVRKIEQLSEKQIAYINKLAHEEAELKDQLDVYKRATAMSSYASPAEHGYSDINPGHFDGSHFGRWMPGMQLKTFGAPQAPVVAPTSPMQLDGSQLEALRQAAVNKAPFSVTIGQKGFEHTVMRDKTAFTEAA